MINPLAPAELVIDHSVVADVFGTSNAFERNVEIEYERNRERYQFLRWGQGAFDDFKVVPPGTGIVHQVNIEHLAQVVYSRGGVAYPDTCVGTDSHTTMVNGLGSWGGASAASKPRRRCSVSRCRCSSRASSGSSSAATLPDGSTATDLVLTITEMLRKHGVVGKFVEFYGTGVGAVPVANRATIGNMSPEYGSTIAIFPVDDATITYLRLTGRSEQQLALVETYAKEQGLWHDPDAEPRYSERLELDLSTIVPSIAGPKRPQDRIELTGAKNAFRAVLGDYVEATAATDHDERGYDEAAAESFPASDSPSYSGDNGAAPPADQTSTKAAKGRASNPVEVTLEDGSRFVIDHGSVVIAAITSCTNTSNPSVMIGAALLAKNAVDKGLSRKPWVKTLAAPGSKVVTDYYERAGLTPYLEKLGFNLVGYGCTTCIGNSGPLDSRGAAAVNEHDLAVAAVLSGNRNFEGRINPDIKLNYLASPPLCVAYALAGSMDIDIVNEPLGTDTDGNDVYLKDIGLRQPRSMSWSQLYQPGDVRHGLCRRLRGRRALDVPADARGRHVRLGRRLDVRAQGALLRRHARGAGAGVDIGRARVLAKLGDSVTTDHISPAGAIKKDSPAGTYLSSTASTRRTSTPTARVAGTTR